MLWEKYQQQKHCLQSFLHPLKKDDFLDWGMERGKELVRAQTWVISGKRGSEPRPGRFNFWRCLDGLLSKSVSAEDCLGSLIESSLFQHSISYTQPRGDRGNMGPNKSQADRNKHWSAFTEQAGPGRMKDMSEDALHGQIPKRAERLTLGAKELSSTASPMLAVPVCERLGKASFAVNWKEQIFCNYRRQAVPHFLNTVWRIVLAQEPLDTPWIMIQEISALAAKPYVGLTCKQSCRLGADC